MKTKITLFLSLLSVLIMTAQTPDGELKRWHKITLDFDGPNTSETASTNPFSDYRLDVTFTSGSKSYTVPGFYSGCSNPEDTSCDSGEVWKVNFAPDRTGTWNWSVSFKTGNDVAIGTGGSSAGFMDGDSGSFTVSESDKSGRDFRSADLGRLQYVGEHYLKHSGSNADNPNGPWFVKAGADSPENTFAYEDFDNTPNRSGRRKAWAPHQQDYNASDASDYTWDSGKGSELLGVVNYLSSEGANAMSFLTFSLGGDDENIFPHLMKVSESEYNGYGDAQQWSAGVHKDRFDVSKLAQWEKVFEYADKKGMYLHFKTMETENDNFMDSNENGRERKLYYRELIARFGHHLALNWNLTEETTLDNDVAIDITEYIHAIDAYDHNIVIHTYPSQKDQRYTPLLGNNSELTGASLQSDTDDVHDDVIEWLEKSKNAGKKWIVANDEQGPANLGVRIDDEDIRQHVLYGTLMAGGAGVEYYYGYTNTDGDLNNQDHRLRGVAYEEAGYALKFFQEYFNDYLIGAESNDGLTGDSDDYVLANNGKGYAVYLPNGGSTSMTLPNGNSSYSVQWFNPRSGDLGAAATLGNTLSAPNSNGDWVALILNNDGDTPPVTCDVYEEADGIVIIEAENRTADLGEWNIETSSLNNAFTGAGYLEFMGNTTTNGPVNSPIEYQFKINEPGLYELHLRCARETVDGRTDVANDCYVRVDGDYGESPNAGNNHNDDAPLAALKSDTKFYGGNDNSFVWADGARLDLGGESNKRGAIYDFKAGETYTLTVSGRSQLFKLDRMMFRKTSVNEGQAESLDNGETLAEDCGNETEENNAPTVAIDTPVNNSTFEVGTDIAFNANATDNDGTIEQVQFFVNGTLLVTEMVIPYTATMSGYAEGTYSITAVATDNDGAITTSSVITVNVGDPIQENNAPTVAIDTPANNASFLEGTDIEFNANATDNDGTIEQVQFFVNGTLLVTERVIPYTATMSGYGEGTYSVTAVATDNEGATTTSAVITVTVGEEVVIPETDAIALPGSFEAEDYETITGTIRTESTPGTSGENLGYIKNNDAVEYTVDVAESGTYTFSVYGSSKGTGGEVNIYSDNVLVGTVNVPVSGTWHDYQVYQTTATLSSGEQTLKLVFNEATSSYLFNIDKLVVIKDEVTVAETAALSPINDAYLQGSTRYNSNNIRVENGKRIGYLMFDLSDVDGTIETLDLQFTIFSDKGNGNVNVNLGMTNSWTETNLSTANSPDVGALVGSLNTIYNLGSTYTISLDASQITGDSLTLILTATSGNDFDFGSKENASSTGPKLLINDGTANKGITLTSGVTIEVYPNPVVDIINFKGDIEGAVVKIYNILGAFQTEALLTASQSSLNMGGFAPGVYLLSVSNVSDEQFVSEIIRVIKH